MRPTAHPAQRKAQSPTSLTKKQSMVSTSQQDKPDNPTSTGRKQQENPFWTSLTKKTTTYKQQKQKKQNDLATRALPSFVLVTRPGAGLPLVRMDEESFVIMCNRIPAQEYRHRGDM